MRSDLRQISKTVFVITLAATLLSTTVFMSSCLIQSTNAQQPTQQQQKAPLNFYLKLANNGSTSQAASQATANGTGTKNITITVEIEQGPSGRLIELPISAVVPTNIQPQDLQLCASLADGSESCQPLAQQGASVDLTQPTEGGATTAPMGTTSPMPAPAPQSYPNNGGAILENAIYPIVETITSSFTIQHADAQLISVEDTKVNIPITVIVPIDLNILNAQICASVASSGDQSCTYVVCCNVSLV
jgi:hypothetical protein